ncbi:MAG: WYL domain-containing protein [Deltaproteobacteria bacterium]|nr:WYL domain-containing protein [Deltaproteobacteria bacterium]
MQPIDFAVVDVETTGLSPAVGERVCEIAIVHLRGDEELETFSTLVNPGRLISSGASAVSGISDSMVAKAPTFREVAAEVARRLSGYVFVAHNAPFDLGFLTAEFQRLRMPLPVSHVIDTLDIARRYYSFLHNNLGTIAARLNISYPHQHRALHDARITAQILNVFARDLARRKVVKIEDLVTSLEKLSSSESEAIRVLPAALREAHDHGLSLEIRYLASNLETSTRRIDPIDISVGRRLVYIRAYCHLRQDERTFRLDRITEMRIVKKEASTLVVPAERRRRAGRKSSG